MGLLLASTSLELLLGVVFLCWSFYRYLTRHYDFWTQRGVPCMKPAFPFGSMKDFTLGRIHSSEAFDAVYKEFPGERFCGVIELHRPVLVIRDPDLVKQILVKDFNHFVDRNPFDANPNEFITQHLFFMDRESWRNMRHKLSPAFSSGKMKSMFELMAKCGQQLSNCLERMIDTRAPVDVKEILAKFTMDIIATCAFGLEINSLSDENTEFYRVGRSLFEPDTKTLIKHKILALFPSLSETLKVKRTGEKITKMLYSMVSETVQYREKKGLIRNDFLDILIKLKQNKSILDGTEDNNGVENVSKDSLKEGLTLEQMTAQAFIFFVAGFETASSTATFCLYELAQHQEVQDRLRREVDDVLGRHGGRITYQALQEMKYMDQVINETLRMYASLAVLHRRCTKQYRVPGSELVLEKGQKVYIPIYSLHHDPQYYPDPDNFDPDRFRPENAKTRHPFVHLPFGDGPRNCIGMRFGLMQTKIGVTTFLSSFKVDVALETPTSIRVQPTSFVTQPKEPVFLRISKR